jgi:hypothetical protein
MEIIEFETRNQQPKIRSFTHSVYPKLKGRDHEAHFSTMSFVSDIYLDDTEYGKRFEAAFRHAVSMCGGRRSTF